MKQVTELSKGILNVAQSSVMWSCGHVRALISRKELSKMTRYIRRSRVIDDM